MANPNIYKLCYLLLLPCGSITAEIVLILSTSSLFLSNINEILLYWKCWCKGSARMRAHISWKERKERLGLERWFNSLEHQLPLQKTQAQVHPRKSDDLFWAPVNISYTYATQTVLYTEQPFTYFFKKKEKLYLKQKINLGWKVDQR